MTLTTELCLEIIDHALPGGPSTPLESMGIVNQAGHWLVSVHPWEWLKNRTADLELRPTVTLTGASWTAATKTLTETGAFAGYSFLAGDQCELAGTGITDGLYTIASRTDNDSIVLVEEINATDVASGITGTLDNDQVALPGGLDLQRIEAYAPSNGLINTFSLTTRQALLDLRTASPGLSTLNFWGLLSWFQEPSGQPVRRFEFYPPQSSGGRLLRIWYTAGWVDLTNSDAIVPIPDYMSGIFLEACKAVAWGHDKEDSGLVLNRLDAILATDSFRRVTERDGAGHKDLGPLTGGALARTGGISSVFDQERRVSNPIP